MQFPRQLFHQALRVMVRAFRRLEAQVPPPQAVLWKDGIVFRYVEQTIEQALIQKLARVVSGLHAVDILLLNGFVQEQGVLNRTLDEVVEDITFLAAAITNDTVTDRHKQYLEAFYAEEFAAGSTERKERNYPPRKKIRAYNMRVLGMGASPFQRLDAGEAISKAYSGFVHAALPHIMDMCGDDPPLFHITGMNKTPRIAEHVDDARNYFYRGLLSMAIVAKAFGDAELVNVLYKYIGEFEAASGTNFSGRAKA